MLNDVRRRAARVNISPRLFVALQRRSACPFEKRDRGAQAKCRFACRCGQVRSSRPLLHLRATVKGVGPEAAPQLVRRAIAGRSCLIATYNQGQVKLAPCVLYQRDEALFLDAVTLERDGRAPRELKLGAFRLSGLRELFLIPESIQRLPDLPVDPNRYSAGILAQLQPAPLRVGGPR